MGIDCSLGAALRKGRATPSSDARQPPLPSRNWSDSDQADVDYSFDNVVSVEKIGY